MKHKNDFVLYRRILFIGKTLLHLHVAYLICIFWWHVVCKWLTLVLPELPAALYLALSLAVGHHWCIFQSELIHTAGLWIADSSRYLACHIFPGCQRCIVDDVRSRLWSFIQGDCLWRERAPICLRFVSDLSKPVGEWKIGLKPCSVNMA